jgi:hypothetical protein
VSIVLRPITQHEAFDFVRVYHRHHRHPEATLGGGLVSKERKKRRETLRQA